MFQVRYVSWQRSLPWHFSDLNNMLNSWEVLSSTSGVNVMYQVPTHEQHVGRRWLASSCEDHWLRPKHECTNLNLKFMGQSYPNGSIEVDFFAQQIWPGMPVVAPRTAYGRLEGQTNFLRFKMLCHDSLQNTAMSKNMDGQAILTGTQD